MTMNMKYILILAAMAGLSACGSKADNAAQQQQAPAAVPVTVTQVQQGNAVYYDEYPATVTALSEVEIRPQVAGYITGIFFKDGQHITKGQKLYSIDPQQYRGAYEQAMANLNVAKANQARAKQDLERYQQLAEQDAIARQVLEHSMAELATAQSQVAAQQANVSSVATNLRYSTIYAPLSGTIGISQVKIGAAVSPGSTVLNVVSSDDPMAVDFSIDQKEISRFVQLQKNGTKPSDSVFTLSLSGGYEYPKTGEIYLIDRALDPLTGTIKVRLVFPNKDFMLRSGMTCNARVKNNADNQQQIMIPYKAVVEQMGEYYVYVVGDSSKAVQKKVDLGRRISENVIVKSGLEGNETLVTEGVQKLREGVKVQAGNAGASQTQPAQQPTATDTSKK